MKGRQADPTACSITPDEVMRIGSRCGLTDLIAADVEQQRGDAEPRQSGVHRICG